MQTHNESFIPDIPMPNRLYIIDDIQYASMISNLYWITIMGKMQCIKKKKKQKILEINLVVMFLF